MNISLKNILCDPTAAQAELEQKQKEITIHNQKATKRNSIVFSVIVLIIITSIAICSYLSQEGGPLHPSAYPTDVDAMGAKCLIAAIVMLAVSVIGEIFTIKKRDVDEECTANAQFRRYSAEYKPLRVELKSIQEESGKTTESRYSLSIIMEDVNHHVHTVNIPQTTIHEIVRTDITEPILNLPENTLYIPYESEGLQ